MSAQTTAPISIHHASLHRTVRVGACPVLTVTVTYPCPASVEGAPEGVVTRFCEAYRHMAENFLSWATDEASDTSPAREALMAFASSGPNRAYTFERRLLECRMEATVTSDGRGLTVERCVSMKVRRSGQFVGPSRRGFEQWRLPGLTLARSQTDFWEKL